MKDSEEGNSVLARLLSNASPLTVIRACTAHQCLLTTAKLGIQQQRDKQWDLTGIKYNKARGFVVKWTPLQMMA